MAAMGSAKSDGGLGQRGRTRPATVPCTHTPARVPSIDEVRCPVCSDILVEPVTMPCRHSVCLHCFERTVEFSLCCPRCRLRVSSWARKRSREKSLVNTELWDMVRKCYPEKCQRRMEQRAGEAMGEGIFRSLTHICKKDLRQDKPKLKVGTHEGKEDKKRKTPLHRKEESNVTKHSQDALCGVLSDSENEEPIGRRTRHVSAFVRKTRHSSAFSRSLPNSLVKRSRSCTDSDGDHRGKMRGLSHFPGPERVSVVHSFNAGILLSTENSRSLSAPVLISEHRRHLLRNVLATASTPFLIPPSKAERSISPESNDSISEELNHFKPIVCSPCTPPKRLPDGRVMEPTIVKSTPRNVRRNLQKATSYEASPYILQKWRQIEVDRQSLIKVTSKGTTTSPIAEELNKEQASKEGNKQCVCSQARDGEQSSLCKCNRQTKHSGMETGKNVVHNKHRLIFYDYEDDVVDCDEDADVSGKPLSNKSTAASKSRPSENVSGHGTDSKACISGHLPDTQTHCCSPISIAKDFKISMAKGKRGSECLSPKGLDPAEPRKEPSVRNCAQGRPTSRQSRKRSQKTKHLEEDRGQVKKRKTEDQMDKQVVCVTPLVDLYTQRLNQEREDRELALRLQRQFDKDRRKTNKLKMTPTKYPLRSWVSTDGQTENNPRRSGRISKKNEHFNC